MSKRPAVLWPRGRVWLVAIGIVLFLFLFFLGSVELLHYTESTPFCTSCHSMYPEKTAYQTSPHQNVGCGTCHIGPGALPAVQSKIAAVRYLYVYPLDLYEKPIPSPVKSLRPVEVVCEQCHWPQKFYSDRLVEIDRFAEDQGNTHSRIYLLLKTGGGSQREGLGKGIHWHVENPVRYRAADRQLQDIPWVQVESNGEPTEYIASDTELSESQIEVLPVHEMDCLDCHNRATHVFRTPADAIDQAMASGGLDASLPYLKREGATLLEPFYDSQDVAAEVIVRDLKAFYAREYPAADQQAVESSAQALADLYGRIKFTDLETDWKAHPNNVGHSDYPGCFRCHDGQHFDAQKQSIRLECNICHNIPQETRSGQPAPLISPVKAVPEPDSHKDSNWIALHRTQFDATCSACHDTANAGGDDNSGFCANSECHGTVWKFAGLDAPAILELENPTERIAERAAAVPHPVTGREDCVACHGPEGVRPFPADHAMRTNDICLGCHEAPATPTPAPTLVPSPTAVATPTETATPRAAIPGVPLIPHSLEGRADCLVCHSSQGVKPFLADHEGRGNDTCTVCHQPAALAPTTEPSAIGSTPVPTSAAVVPVAIPHPLGGREDCLLCHAKGTVKPYPPDHEGRSKETCSVCHQPGSAPVPGAGETPVLTQLPPVGADAPAIPHDVEERVDCQECHALGSVKPYPPDHVGRGNQMCMVCHREGEAESE
jgi:predicted CXXCH cytochrome family protein